MGARLFGIETEYASASVGSDGGGAALNAAEKLLQMARRNWQSLPCDGGNGIFVTNASRIYQDVGAHLELATCEVDSPDDLVRYAAAGDSLVASLAEEYNAKEKGRKIIVSKHNVEYLRPGVTWAQHESYCHGHIQCDLASQLIPHLVSRIYSFAGGLNPLCAGIEFSVSPRMHLITEVISECTTGNRGIFNTRNESHSAEGFSRLHLICADSLNSQLGLWLRSGTTAIVLALVEAGLNPGGNIKLADPVAALHAFAVDPFFRATAATNDGRKLTLIEIQRQYLNCTIRNQNHSKLPPWTRDVCKRWSETLDLLEKSPGAVEGMFDWSTKLPLFMAHARDRGVDPESFRHWNYCLDRISLFLKQSERPTRLSAELMKEKGGRLAEYAATFNGYLKEHGLDWRQVGDVLNLRDELCEIDLRFGQISPPGLFAALENNLRHQVVEVFNGHSDPRFVAPRTTRARMRGAAVRRYAGSWQVTCDWSFVRNSGRLLDLSHPFGVGARWRTATAAPAVRDHDILEMVQMICDPHASRQDIDVHLRRGDLDLAFETLRSGHPRIWELASGRQIACPPDEHELPMAVHVMTCLALVQTRRGFSAEAVAALDRRRTMQGAASHVAARNPPELEIVNEYLRIYRRRGLCPHGREFQQWIHAGDLAMRNAISISYRDAAGYFLFRANLAARMNRYQEAIEMLLPFCESDWGALPVRLRAECMCELADIFRRMNYLDSAAAWLNRAEQLLARQGFHSDLMDFTLTGRLRLDPASAESTNTLRRIKRAQYATGSRVALVRTLLLEGRCRPSIWRNSRRLKVIAKLAETVPDLAACPTLRHIMNYWSAWTSGGPDPDSTSESPDPFWGI